VWVLELHVVPSGHAQSKEHAVLLVQRGLQRPSRVNLLKPILQVQRESTGLIMFGSLEHGQSHVLVPGISNLFSPLAQVQPKLHGL